MLLNEGSNSQYRWFQRLLTDDSPRLQQSLKYTIYGKSGVFDAERFIDVMEAFETFTLAARSGGGQGLEGSMANLGVIPVSSSASTLGVIQQQQVQTRAALAFLFSAEGDFFREFILDEVWHPILNSLLRKLGQDMAGNLANGRADLLVRLFAGR